VATCRSASAAVKKLSPAITSACMCRSVKIAKAVSIAGSVFA
jgi:hypothetical protein